MYGGTRQVSSLIGTRYKYEYTLCLKGEAFPYVSIIHIKYTRTANLIKKNLKNDKQTEKCKVRMLSQLLAYSSMNYPAKH